MTLVVLAAIACAPSRYDEATLALLDVNVITLQGEAILEDHMVVVSGDRILAVEPTDRQRLTSETPLVQGDGAYLLPGLADMHTHVITSTKDALERTFPLLVANGITTVRDMGSEIPILQEVRARLEAEPDRVAPRLFAAGPLLDGTRKPWYGELPLILETPDDAREHLPRLREAGVDFFKIYDDLEPATYAAIAAEAKTSGLPFAGHVPYRVPVPRSVELGQRTIEHLGLGTVKDCVDDPVGWFGRAINAKFREGYDSYYRVMLEHWESVDWPRCASVLTALGRPTVYFTPTLDMELNDRSRLDTSTVRYMSSGSRSWCEQVLEKIDAADPALRERVFSHYLAALRRIHEAGAQLLVGTDTPNNCVVEGFALHSELELFTEAGLTPLEALRAATVDAARALDRQDVAGRIEVGREADLVLLERNPLEDVTHTRSVAGVVLRGRWLDREELGSMLDGALLAAQDSDEP